MRQKIKKLKPKNIPRVNDKLDHDVLRNLLLNIDDTILCTHCDISMDNCSRLSKKCKKGCKEKILHSLKQPELKKWLDIFSSRLVSLEEKKETAAYTCWLYYENLLEDENALSICFRSNNRFSFSFETTKRKNRENPNVYDVWGKLPKDENNFYIHNLKDPKDPYQLLEFILFIVQRLNKIVKILERYYKRI